MTCLSRFCIPIGTRKYCTYKTIRETIFNIFMRAKIEFFNILFCSIFLVEFDKMKEEIIMNIKLKLNHFSDISEETLDYIQEVRGLGNRLVKITTNELKVQYDKKDNRLIKSIDNLKLIYELKNGCLLLLGNLGCTFRDGFKGEFFCKKIIIEENSDFNDIRGAEVYIDFSDPLNAISNDDLYDNLNELKNAPNLVYNIGQFDEFMELFQFYKSLSNELSNNISYEISHISKEYCFISINEKDFDLEYKEEVLDNNNVLIGYRFEEYQYEQLTNDLKEKVSFLFDIEIQGDNDAFRKIKSIGLENIYLSDYKVITEKEISKIVQVQIYNLYCKKDKIVISGELKNNDLREFTFLNLYDMGQKIKVESIDNSLKLIKQGATGSASELLRYLIGDEVMPNHPRHTNRTMEKYMEGLNESQRQAFLMAIDGSPVSLIKGPPGTGKTYVINAIVQYITKELEEKVIISSQTHIAIDNVLDKLMSNSDAIIPNRITNRKNKYSGSEIDKTLYRTWGLKFLEHNKKASNSALASKIALDISNFKGEPKFIYSLETEPSEYSVIGATTTTSAIAGKKGLEVLRGYDWLIIDEVSKCPITEVLRYLPYVEKIIMVGDDFQLAPLLEFTKEEVENLPSYNEDLFEKLKSMYENSVFAKTLEKAKKCNRVIQLNENYRSVKDVLELYNVFYDGSLIGRREEINPSKVEIDSKHLKPECDVFFVEVKNGKEVLDGTSRYNIEEINATRDILDELIKTTINPEKVSIAAIFPYAAQISKFHKLNIDLINKAKQVFKSFEIDTVDAFQGKEADIVLCNTVVADASRRNFLNDFRRINVSMSRAKDKLIVFGNSIVLSKIEMSILDGPKRRFFKDIIEHIVSHKGKIVYDGGIQNETTSKAAIEFAKY